MNELIFWSYYDIMEDCYNDSYIQLSQQDSNVHYTAEQIWEHVGDSPERLTTEYEKCIYEIRTKLASYFPAQLMVDGKNDEQSYVVQDVEQFISIYPLSKANLSIYRHNNVLHVKYQNVSNDFLIKK